MQTVVAWLIILFDAAFKDFFVCLEPSVIVLTTLSD